ncbi:Imm10 family immunity protein [Caballeronia sp. Lep1P3]|uniref:Imm10 family immunity protein n=1 Tax=Caballeronia sp. Lep1P3 TaxID=2878150 RepID=UPI001FD55382|nr:Imm10 family immunity protein [Caballeronia sp. Lep1P3]
MKLKFTAGDVSYALEDGIHMLSLVDDPSSPHDYVIFQRGTDFDDQDRALGQDTYYVEIAENGVAGYGGVASISYRDRALEIRLEGNAKWRQRLELVEVEFKTSSAQSEMLKQGLLNVFAGTSTDLSFS